MNQPLSSYLTNKENYFIADYLCVCVCVCGGVLGFISFFQRSLKKVLSVNNNLEFSCFFFFKAKHSFVEVNKSSCGQ